MVCVACIVALKVTPGSFKWILTVGGIIRFLKTVIKGGSRKR